MTSHLIEERVALIRQIPLFSCLTEQELRSVAKVAAEITCRKHNILISDGDTTSSLYMVLEGRARAISIDHDGRQIVLNTFGKGEYFGEMSFIDGEPRCGTVETTTFTRLLKIRREGLTDILGLHPDIVFQLMKGLAHKVRHLTRQIEELVFLDVYGRVARLLMRLAEPRDGHWVIREKLTQQELAEIIGCSREMISRIFKELVLGGYIAREKKVITIHKKLPHSW